MMKKELEGRVYVRKGLMVCADGCEVGGGPADYQQMLRVITKGSGANKRMA